MRRKKPSAMFGSREHIKRTSLEMPNADTVYCSIPNENSLLSCLSAVAWHSWVTPHGEIHKGLGEAVNEHPWCLLLQDGHQRRRPLLAGFSPSRRAVISQELPVDRAMANKELC